MPLVRASPSAAHGRILRADPDNYRELLRNLRAGDTLRLAAGNYERGLPLHRLIGTDQLPIVIEGEAAPARAARFLARSNAHTVSILDSAYVVVRDLVLEGLGAAVDAVRAEGHARSAHHITLENLLIRGHNATQQNSGISTKCPAWGWVVRNNTIEGAGTGMYFGDSDGSDPFFDSLIEGNRLVDCTGYGIQIKHQHARGEGAPVNAPTTTVIRRNLVVKNRVASSPEVARPSLLVGHWPLAGAGSQDRYVIYGNVLFDNPSEALFQGEGNVAFYNNLLVNPRGEGLRIQPHNHRPREVAVFGNTIVAASVAVEVTGGEAGYARMLEHNVILGNPPLRGELDGDNHTGPYDRADRVLAAISADLERIDLRLRAGVPAPRSAISAPWRELPQAQQDFLGLPRGQGRYGACPSMAIYARPCRLPID